MVEASYQPSLVFALAAVVLAVGLYRGLLSISNRTIAASAPWAFAAGVFVVAAHADVYAVVRPEPTALDLLAFVTFSAVVVWVSSVRLASLRDHPYRARYLAASGTGAGLVALFGVLTSVGPVDPIRLVWFAITPVGAVLFGAAGYFVLGLVYTDALVEFELPGLYALSAIVFDGFASAAAVEVLGGTDVGVVTQLVQSALAVAGLSLETWLLLPFHVLLAVVLVGGFGWLARQNEAVGNGCAVVASAVALWSATVVLLSATFLA